MLERYQRAAGTVWRNAHGSVFVLPADASDVVVLTGTGQELWLLLSEPMTIEDAAHSLADAYGVPAAAVSSDVTPVVHDLAARGVLDQK